MTENKSRYARGLAWLDQRVIRRLYTERVRRIILQSLPFWIASLLVGFVAVGREGPTIQISAAIFRAINRLQPTGWPQLFRQIALITGQRLGWLRLSTRPSAELSSSLKN